MVQPNIQVTSFSASVLTSSFLRLWGPRGPALSSVTLFLWELASTSEPPTANSLEHGPLTAEACLPRMFFLRKTRLVGAPITITGHGNHRLPRGLSASWPQPYLESEAVWQSRPPRGLGAGDATAGRSHSANTEAGPRRLSKDAQAWGGEAKTVVPTTPAHGNPLGG